MEYVKLGNSNLIVSRICLGCMGFGDPNKGQHKWVLSEEESTNIIRYALEKGINFFDTALAYQSGTSEYLLGKAIKKYAKRDKVVIASKFLPRTKEEIQNGITMQQHIYDSCNASIKNLNMDYLDLYIYHMWDYNSDIYDVMEGLNNLIKAGKVKYIGISNCFPNQLKEANETAEKYGFAKFISMQGHYNLIFREEENQMNPYCYSNNIALTPYSPLASGRLSRIPETITKRLESDQYAKYKYDSTKEKDDLIISRVYELSKKHNTTMTTISLAWLLKKVTCPVVGVTKQQHIDCCVDSLKFSLTKEEMDYLEELYVQHELVGVMKDNR